MGAFNERVQMVPVVLKKLTLADLILLSMLCSCLFCAISSLSVFVLHACFSNLFRCLIALSNCCENQGVWRGPF